MTTTYYTSFQQYLSETGRQEDNLGMAKQLIAENVVLALRAMNLPHSPQDVRYYLSSTKIDDIIEKYQVLPETNDDVMCVLKSLRKYDSTYLGALFSGPFLDEPVAVSVEGNLTVISRH